MKKSIPRLTGIVAFAIIALAAAFWSPGNLSLTPGKVLAQVDGDTDGADFVLWQKVIGVTATQVIRIMVANRNPDEEHTISYRCVASDQAGVVVFTSPTQSLMVGDFDSVDLSYAGLNMTPEPATGRKQVMLQVIELRRNRRASSIVGAMEIINDDGTTAAYERFDVFR